jgi:1,4-dihydroxy-2-naphthoate octaprenyltransferase
LAAAAGWELVIVGAISVLAALGYSGGPYPYGSRGLGEVFVFIFFGVVATVGSAYVQAEQVVPLAVAASVPVGFLASAILVVNNLRDIETDAPTGKRTLAVMLGAEQTQLLYRVLILGSYVALAGVAVGGGGLPAFLALLSLPLAIQPLKRVAIAKGRGLIAVLVATARLQLAFGVLLAVGLWI